MPFGSEVGVGTGAPVPRKGPRVVRSPPPLLRRLGADRSCIPARMQCAEIDEAQHLILPRIHTSVENRGLDRRFGTRVTITLAGR